MTKKYPKGVCIMETWKEITWTDGLYYVSDMENIKKVGGKQFGSKIYKNPNRILIQKEQNSGYLIVKLYVKKRHYTRLVHRLVAQAFLGDEPGMDVNHKNGDKHDNRLSNLEWCTRKESMEHCSRNGLRKDIRKVAAIKNGKVVAKADFSREIVEKLGSLLPSNTSSETKARAIRKKIDTGVPYHGFTFVSF